MEKNKKNRNTMLTQLFIIFSVMFLIPFTNNYFLNWIFILSMIYSILSLSWFFMDEFGGRVNLGIAIPFGLSAYITSITYLMSNLWVSLIFGWMISTACTTLFFYLLYRIDRVSFVFITFISCILLWIVSHSVVVKVDGFIYGGEEGFSLSSTSILSLYTTSFVFLSSISIVLAMFSFSHMSLPFKAFRDDEKSARSVGIKVERLKLLITLITSCIASLSGILYALLFSHTSPEMFSIHISIFPFIVSILSRNSIPRIILASFLLVALSDYMNSALPNSYLLLYAIILILSPKLANFRVSSAILRWRISDG
jgi:branched-chain amino acid transport system permease protein